MGKGLDGRREAQGSTTLDNAGPLLETKLYVPKPRRGLVARPRLSERLSRGAESKLTLISAPAGFGKSTLLAEWLAAAPAGEQSVAWLSLDQADNQPVSFWTYLLTALQTVAPGVGARALSVLQEPQPPPIQTVLATVLNELSAVPNDIVLVLDDYHLVDAHDIQDGMAFLLEHLPSQIHLVIATRADPGLPLGRLRGSGELTEIRAADLRFTPDEAAAYLNEAMGLDLAARDVAALEARTEGWIAALQLAALSIQGRDDVAGFIAGFSGDDRYIVDYLVEEVLHRQPEAVRSFLLQTSILSRLSGPLCDAVTGQDGGKAMLEALDRGNLFLVPLDDRRRWYRYHHLFADVLRAHLLDEQPHLVPDLNRRASTWFERQGNQAEAILHAIEAEDFARAADLIELAAHQLRVSRQELTLRRWLDALPDSVFETRPVLAIAHVGALLATGELAAVEDRLAAAEHWVSSSHDAHEREAGAAAGMIVRHTEALAHLPSAIALYRAALARMRGDVVGTAAHARAALELAGSDQPLERGGAAGMLALAYWTGGDLDAAHGAWSEAVANLERAGHLADVLGCSIAMADIRFAQGRLQDARRTYEHGLRIGTQAGPPPLRGTADMHVGMSELCWEWNDLASANRHIEASVELGESMGLPQNPYRLRVAIARVREAEGDLGAALDLLDEADRLYVSDFFPNVRPIAARKARLWIAEGRLGEALGWAGERGLSAQDELSYLSEFEHITLARVLLAESGRDRAGHSTAEAMGLLERLLNAAEQGGRTGSVMEILVLQALAHQLQGNVPATRAPLERAIALAEPEGYVRIFVDEGAPVAVLLGTAVKRGIAPTYVRELLAALGRRQDRTPIKQALIEPLSERELDVLRLLAGDLDGPDIARELVVSLNTVRSHTKNIYAKLGVNNRRAAVSRAAELDLLSQARGR